jgi:SAM-dependent methyltransferase
MDGQPVVLTINDLGDKRQLRVEGIHSRRGKWVETSEMETTYSQELVQALYAEKGSFVLNEIERSEDPLMREKVLSRLHRYEIDIAGKRVLDFGCGPGASAAVLLQDASRPPESFLGVDINEDYVAIARQRLAEHGFGATADFRLIGMNDPLEFIDNDSLDMAFAFEVFEHVAPRDRPVLIDILWSKLAPGGLFYLTSPTRLSPLDSHTTGLLFTYWLPLPLAGAYARTLSRRCRGKSNEKLVAGGIKGFSYFEMKRYLATLPHVDLSLTMPLKQKPAETTAEARLWTKFMWPVHRVALRHFGPYDAFAPHCVFCFQKI